MRWSSADSARAGATGSFRAGTAEAAYYPAFGERIGLPVTAAYSTSGSRRPARPGDRAELGIDAHLGELALVREPSEHALEADHRSEIELTLNAVLEAQAHAVPTQRSNLDDVFQHVRYSRGAMRFSFASRRARSQLSINSTGCLAAHSMTRPRTLGGRRPLRTSRGRIERVAFLPA